MTNFASKIERAKASVIIYFLKNKKRLNSIILNNTIYIV